MTKMKRKSSTSSDVGSPAKKPRKGPEAAVEVVKVETILPSTSSVCSEFSAHCSSIREIFQDAKAQLDDGKDVQDMCNQGIVTLSKLISLHRTRVGQVSADQQKTHQAMVDSDKCMLKLENLQYEQDNLQHKIDEARNSPVIANVVLLSEEEFASQAPEHLKSLARQSEHMHQLTRLQFEVMNRAQLAQDLKSVQRQVSTVAKEIGGCERQHEAVSTELRQLLEVAKTFEKKTCFSKRPSPSIQTVQQQRQQQLVAGEEVVPELEGADHLPEPLYLLCKKAQMVRAGQGCVLSMCVEKGCKIGALDNGQSLVGRASAGHSSHLPTAEALALVEAHPYSCTVTVSTQGSSKAGKLQFFYHPSLMLISVNHNLDAAALASLEAGDDGLTCPRLLPSCHSQFTGQLPVLLQAGVVGRLYHWAQRLAGLEFLSVVKRKETGSSSSDGSGCSTSSSPCSSWNQIIDLLTPHL